MTWCGGDVYSMCSFRIVIITIRSWQDAFQLLPELDIHASSPRPRPIHSES